MKIDLHKTANYFFLSVGLVVSVLGAGVMAGWYLHIFTLVQPRSASAPMQYNSALCFLLSGIGLAALYWKRTTLSLALGTIVTIVASLTLVEYAFGFNAGIDTFLV